MESLLMCHPNNPSESNRTFDHGVMDRFLNLSELPVLGTSAIDQIFHQSAPGDHQGIPQQHNNIPMQQQGQAHHNPHQHPTAPAGGAAPASGGYYPPHEGSAQPVLPPHLQARVTTAEDPHQSCYMSPDSSHWAVSGGANAASTVASSCRTANHSPRSSSGVESGCETTSSPEAARHNADDLDLVHHQQRLPSVHPPLGGGEQQYELPDSTSHAAGMFMIPITEEDLRLRSQATAIATAAADSNANDDNMSVNSDPLNSSASEYSFTASPAPTFESLLSPDDYNNGNSNIGCGLVKSELDSAPIVNTHNNNNNSVGGESFQSSSKLKRKASEPLADEDSADVKVFHQLGGISGQEFNTGRQVMTGPPYVHTVLPPAPSRSAAKQPRKSNSGPARTKAAKSERIELSCPLCEYTTRVKEHLTSHMNSHASERRYMCGQCGQTFKWSHSLRRHQRTHQKENYKLACSHCPKTFSRKDHLAVHERLHDPSDRAESFPCPECGVTFKNKKTLTGHLKTHTADKPYQCTACDSAFTRRASLTRHVLATHEGQTYVCETCNALFSYKSTLEDHRRAVHNEGRRDFRCTACGLTFACKAYLQKHLDVCKAKEDRRELKCLECEQTFPSSRQLQDHVRLKHRQRRSPPATQSSSTTNGGLVHLNTRPASSSGLLPTSSSASPASSSSTSPSPPSAMQRNGTSSIPCMSSSFNSGMSSSESAYAQQNMGHNVGYPNDNGVDGSGFVSGYDAAGLRYDSPAGVGGKMGTSSSNAAAGAVDHQVAAHPDPSTYRSNGGSVYQQHLHAQQLTDNQMLGHHHQASHHHQLQHQAPVHGWPLGHLDQPLQHHQQLQPVGHQVGPPPSYPNQAPPLGSMMLRAPHHDQHVHHHYHQGPTQLYPHGGHRHFASQQQTYSAGPMGANQILPPYPHHPSGVLGDPTGRQVKNPLAPTSIASTPSISTSSTKALQDCVSRLPRPSEDTSGTSSRSPVFSDESSSSGSGASENVGSLLRQVYHVTTEGPATSEDGHPQHHQAYPQQHQPLASRSPASDSYLLLPAKTEQDDGMLSAYSSANCRNSVPTPSGAIQANGNDNLMPNIFLDFY